MAEPSATVETDFEAWWTATHPYATAPVIVKGFAREAYLAALTRQAAEIAALRGALEYGIGCAKNELVARGLPLEWATNSGIGRMERALAASSSHATRLLAVVEAAKKAGSLLLAGLLSSQEKTVSVDFSTFKDRAAFHDALEALAALASAETTRQSPRLGRVRPVRGDAESWSRVRAVSDAGR
jgi:hypothetical protein